MIKKYLIENNSLKDLIKSAEKIKQKAQTTKERRSYQMAIIQIEATGRLIKSIKDMDSRESPFRGAAFVLSFVVIFFTAIQIVNILFKVTSLINIIISGLYTFALIWSIYTLFKRKS